MSDVKEYMISIIDKLKQSSTVEDKEEYISELACLIERSVYIKLDNLDAIISIIENIIIIDLEVINDRALRESYFLCAVRIVEYKHFFQIKINDLFVNQLVAFAKSNEELIYVIQIIGMTRNKKYLSILKVHINSSVKEIRETVGEALIELKS